MAHRGIILAGLQSGSGKTAVTCTLLAALRELGERVQPCKVGPDFLDTAWHRRYAGVPSRNLDTWLMGERQVLGEIQKSPADVLQVVEGVMGLFDGGDPGSDAGSAMELSRLTGWPVLLVLPCAKAGRSLAAAVRGFQAEAGTGSIAGLILNQTGGESHHDYLRQALEPLGLPVVGAVAREGCLAWPERHLGLCAVQEQAGPEPKELAALGLRCLDVQGIRRAARELQWCGEPADEVAGTKRLEGLRIAVARDDIFHFYYEANLEWLGEQGAHLVEFSPLHDAAVPRADAVLIGGGFPESGAELLAENREMLASLRDFSQSGQPLYAECGGLIYLSEGLRGADGRFYPLCGIVPGAVEMTGRLQHFGYALGQGARGEVRGHEFHYSRWIEEEKCANLWTVKKRRNGTERREGWCGGSTAASYLHLWFPSCAEHMVGMLSPR